MSQPGKKSSTPSRIAMVEDEDEATGEAIPDTRVEAKQKPFHTSSTQGVRPRSPSDSGYSSFDNRSQNAASSLAAGTSGAPAVAPPQDAAAAVTRRTSTAVSSRSGSKKPVVVQPSRSETSRSDPPRHDTTYESNLERKYTLPERDRFAQAQSRSQYTALPVQHPAAQATPVSAPRSTPMGPPPVPSADQTRRRRSSTSARPKSIHGYPGAAPLPGDRMSFDASTRGPPPSRSAYAEYGMPVQPQPYSGYYTPSPVYGPIPPNVAAPVYPIPSPPTPTSPNYNGSFSARAGVSVPAYGGGAPYVSRPPLGRTPSISARIPIVHPRESGRPRIQYDPSYEQAVADDEYFTPRPLLGVEQRPALSTHASAGDVPLGLVRRDSRRESRSAEQSEVGLGYLDPLGRYAVGPVERSLSARPDLSSRRMSSYGVPPSRGDVSTQGLEEALTRVTLEDRNGRRVVYWTEEQLRRFKEKDREDELANRRVQERLLKVERQSRQIDNYVRANGTTSQDLTVEALQMRQIEQGVPSQSSRRSHRSKASGSRLEQGIVIRHAEAGASLHVSGDVHVEMRQSENGGCAEFVVTSGSGMDKSYHASSRSSRSGTDRSRNSGDNARRRYYEDYNEYDSNGYERGM